MEKPDSLKLSYCGLVETVVEDEGKIGGVLLTLSEDNGDPITTFGIYNLTTGQIRLMACNLIEYAGRMRDGEDRK
jgi:hypothetical protein